MEIIKNSRGRLNLRGTLKKMKAGDELTLDESEVNMNYLRNVVCVLNRQFDLKLHVSGRKNDAPVLTVYWQDE